MSKKYIIIATEDADKDRVIENVAEMDYLIKVDESGGRKKISYSPEPANTEAELIKFLNKKYPDLEFLITANPIYSTDHLKNGQNVTFEAGTTIGKIAGKYRQGQLYPNQPNNLKSVPSSGKTKSKKSNWLLFILIIIFILLFFVFDDYTYKNQEIIDYLSTFFD